MNIGSRSTNDLLFMTFNQDYSCLAIGTRQGYRIYNCDPFGKCYGRSDGGIGIIEMLFCTSLVALVGAGSQAAFSPRRLQVSNTKRQSTICELTYPSAVLAVRLNRRRLVVMLETNIYLYDVSNMRVLHTLDTAPNPRAVCALSPSPDSCFLAYPTHGGAGSAAGEILLFDAIDLQAVHIIAAHKTPVAALAFNDDGTLLASASDKGTVIRIFAVPSGEKLYQFRRGSYPATIYSMAFRRDSSLLAVSSDTDTIHIFRLNKHGSKPSDAAGGSGGSGARGFGADPGADASLDASFGSAATGLSSTSGPGTPKPADHRPRRESSGLVGAARRHLTDTLLRGGTSLASPLASVGSKVGAYILPDAISEMWEPQRDFASAKLPSPAAVAAVGSGAHLSAQPGDTSTHAAHAHANAGGTSGGKAGHHHHHPWHTAPPSLVALSAVEPHLLVVTADGDVFQYHVNLATGGECTLLKHIRVDMGDAAAAAAPAPAAGGPSGAPHTPSAASGAAAGSFPGPGAHGLGSTDARAPSSDSHHALGGLPPTSLGNSGGGGPASAEGSHDARGDDPSSGDRPHHDAGDDYFHY